MHAPANRNEGMTLTHVPTGSFNPKEMHAMIFYELYITRPLLLELLEVKLFRIVFKVCTVC